MTSKNESSKMNIPQRPFAAMLRLLNGVVNYYIQYNMT